MIAPICLGILLLGIVITPSVFAGDGCGTGTVLVDGVCQLAPQESSDGCGAGTVMDNGVCQLDKSSGTSIPPLYIAGGAAAIGAAIVGNEKPAVSAEKTADSSEAKKEPTVLAEKPKGSQKTEPEVFSRYYRSPETESPKVKSKSKKPNPFCEECGSKIAAKDMFCINCGAKR